MRICCLHLVASALLSASLVYAEDPNSKKTIQSDWDRLTALQYLDAREQSWLSWPAAERDHGTVCVSCHTTLPYAIARATTHTRSEQMPLSPQETQMLRYVTQRVTLWKEIEPFYDSSEQDPRKSEESRGSEAVLNALILARYDESNGRIRGITKDALQNMSDLQIKAGDEAGSWDWLNFKEAPWESDSAQYWGATLAAVAYGSLSVSYRKQPVVQPHVALLRTYLIKHYDKQPLMNRASVLWASSKLSGLLTHAQREALLKDIASRQQQDGGWTTANLGSWKRRDGTSLDIASDGYATALIVYAMHEAGVPPSDRLIREGRKWLVRNQAPDGHWKATSLNKQRDPASYPAKFMSDAATAYATVALSSIPLR
jgi:squalene-hopene/tetraprenyl-beta-curcumene cyclase